MARFQVDSAELGAAGAATRGCAERISGEVAAMMAHLNSLEGSWVGAASVAFGQCAAQWRATQAQVETSLLQISAALDGASGTYSDAETRAASLFAAR